MGKLDEIESLTEETMRQAMEQEMDFLEEDHNRSFEQELALAHDVAELLGTGDAVGVMRGDWAGGYGPSMLSIGPSPGYRPPSDIVTGKCKKCGWVGRMLKEKTKPCRCHGVSTIWDGGRASGWAGGEWHREGEWFKEGEK